jgi:hypothetical protein
MTKPLGREIATERAELPHKFADVTQDGPCETCGAAVDDARHVSWQLWEVASRETAAEKPMWEIGS